MRISGRTLVISLLAGLMLLCGCVAVFLLSSRTLSGPPIEVPAEAAQTAPVPVTTADAPHSTARPAVPERRRLTLEFPPKIRAGDSDLLFLTLEVDDLGNITPTVQLEGNAASGEVIEFPNLYETHQVIAEARLDLAGVEVSPGDVVSEALSPGNPIRFQWSIHPANVGVYRGTVWLYLRFLDKQTGEESRKTMSAQIVEIEAVNLWGLSGEFARTTGIVGSVLGTIMGFPFFEDIVKFILNKRNKVNK